jgi:hypothetical protein
MAVYIQQTRADIKAFGINDNRCFCGGNARGNLGYLSIFDSHVHRTVNIVLFIYYMPPFDEYINALGRTHGKAQKKK